MSYPGTRILEPAGPYVTIHKGWQDPLLIKSTVGCHPATHLTDPFSPRPPTSSRPLGGVGQKRFEFVESNVPGPPKDAKVRKLIRSYARKKSANRKQKPISSRKRSSQPTHSSQENFTTDHLDTGTSHPSPRDPLSHPRLIGAATTLSSLEWPIDMQPRDHLLLERYLTATSSRMSQTGMRLHFNPTKSRGYLQFAVTDDAMLEAMLYAAAVYLALLEGKTESWDMMYHKNETISIINKRLSHSASDIKDSTISAISCLALGEAVTGHRRAWDMHMRGLQQILQRRGSITSLGIMLQIKLQRTDICGAIDFAAEPYLQFERSKRPSIWSTLLKQKLQAIRKDITNILTECGVHQELIAVMTDLAYFATTLYSARSEGSVPVDRAAFVEDMYTIECRLLTHPTKCHIASHNVDEACKLGALLYMKAILEEFPHSKTGPSILLGKLQETLYTIPKEEATAPLLLWLCTIGAVFSKVTDRAYFICVLAELTSITNVNSFQDDEIALSNVLPLQQVFGTSLDKLWEDVMVVKGSQSSTQQPVDYQSAEQRLEGISRRQAVL